MKILFVVIILVILVALWYLVTNRARVLEHFQISSEAIQNVGSIYNTNQMTIGKLTTSGDIRNNGPNLILGGSQGKNRWIIHAPDDDRRGLWVAPGNGTDNWDWGKGASFMSNGVFGIGNGWTFDATDGHLRFKYNGDQKFVIHNNGKAWSASEGWIEDLVKLKNSVVNGQGEKRNGDKGRGWNNKNCSPSTSGDCTDLCPAGYYMSGISAGDKWDHKHPVCTKFM